MRRNVLSICTMLVLVFFVVGNMMTAQTKDEKKTTKAHTSKFMVMLPHTKEECMNALDELSKDSPKMLEKISFGCMHDDHTGYAMIEAKDEASVRAMIPTAERDKAKIVQIDKFTVGEIKKMHEAMHQ